MKIAIIGSGYWGPKLVKNFYAIPEISIKYINTKKIQPISNGNCFSISRQD